MNYRIIACQQRSPEWVEARLGRVCGSRAADMLRRNKGNEEAAGRRNLRTALVLERLTGRSLDAGYVSAAMQQGIEREADAAALHEAITGELLSFVGYVSRTDLMAGCSPDGVVMDGERIAGLIEVKSPIPATHLEYLRTGAVPGDYAKQVLHNLFVTGADWCDWLSYNPDFPEALQMKRVRVHRDEAAIAAYRRALDTFLEEVAIELDQVRTLADLPGQLARAVRA
jgi:hypothetical protein